MARDNLKDIYESIRLKESINFDSLVNQIASESHEDWRKEWKKAHGDEPRIKKTKDINWIKKNNGIEEVDISKTPYNKLPSDWQKENKESAKAVATGIINYLEKGGKIEDKDLIDSASDYVHDEWLKRNGDWAQENQKGKFKDLSKEEQDKDRAFVHKALEKLKQLK